jgi:acyl carrier protein
METRIKKIFSNVLDIDIESINNETSADNVKNWDSLKHMNLIIALEEEFDFEFDNDEIADSLSYFSILKIVNERH